MLFAAATVFAVGVCFFWPTMLGFVNESLPKTGALGLAIMGGAGMLSTSFVLPIMGRMHDAGVALRLPPGTTAAELASAAPGTAAAQQWTAIQAAAGLESLTRIAVLPAILTVVFLVLLLARRRRPATARANGVQA
jgi:hypothetical protein